MPVDLQPDLQGKVAAGFREDEELVMPFPNMESSDEEEAPLPVRMSGSRPVPKPSAEFVNSALYGSQKHAHADRSMHARLDFFDALRSEEGRFAIAPEARLKIESIDATSADDFAARLQSTPCLLHR